MKKIEYFAKVFGTTSISKVGQQITSKKDFSKKLNDFFSKYGFSVEVENINNNKIEPNFALKLLSNDLKNNLSKLKHKLYKISDLNSRFELIKYTDEIWEHIQIYSILLHIVKEQNIVDFSVINYFSKILKTIRFDALIVTLKIYYPKLKDEEIQNMQISELIHKKMYYDVNRFCQKYVGKKITIARNYVLKPNQHHIPGYIIHGWIDGHITKFITDNYTHYMTPNVFYEPGFNIQFNAPMTRKNLKDMNIAFEYNLASYVEQPTKRHFIVNFDVKVKREDGFIFAYTSDQLKVFGPIFEIVKYYENIFP